MAEYGIEIRDASGNIVLDSESTTNRLWYSGIQSSNVTVYFANSINHEPAIVFYGINGPGGSAEPVMQNGECIGIEITTDNPTLFLVFARE